jgi:hypothetical protein
MRAGCKIRKTDTDFNYCRRITANVRAEESPMIKVSVMYPNTPAARFDHDYYRDKHMPLVKARMGDACKVLHGRQGHGRWRTRRSRHLCRDVSHLLRLGRGLPGRLRASRQGDHGDIPNYTDQSPVIQISEVVVG